MCSDPLPLSQALRERSSKGERRPKPETPHVCRPVSHSELAGGETGSTKQMSAPLPSAIAPVRCHARCCASQEKGGCVGHVDLGGSSPRHNRGRLTRNQDDGAVVLALPARLEWHQPVRGLAASRYDWLRSVEWRAEPHDRRRSDGACCPAWPGRLDSDLSVPPKNYPHGTAVNNCS